MIQIAGGRLLRCTRQANIAPVGCIIVLVCTNLEKTQKRKREVRHVVEELEV